METIKIFKAFIILIKIGIRTHFSDLVRKNVELEDMEMEIEELETKVIAVEQENERLKRELETLRKAL